MFVNVTVEHVKGENDDEGFPNLIVKFVASVVVDYRSFTDTTENKTNVSDRETELTKRSLGSVTCCQTTR